MKQIVRTLLLASGAMACAFAQPVVTGALNTASYAVPGLPNSDIAQGSMIAIFGRNLGPAGIVQASTFPLPINLGGTTAKITAGGQNFDLILTYTIAAQVGAIVPSTVPVGAAQLTVSYQGATSAAFPVTITKSQFGAFAINQAGSGPAVIQNYVSGTELPVNSVLNVAIPGQTVILWGTGLGPIQGSDAGTPPVGNLVNDVEVLVGGKKAVVTYAGRSGCCSGIDQIVFQVPTGVTGCQVSVLVTAGGRVSNATSMSIANAAGRCSDPFGYTNAELSKAETSGGLNVGAIQLSRIKSTISMEGQTMAFTADAAAGSFSRYNTTQLIASQNFSSAAIGACTVYTYRGETQEPVDPIQPTYLDAGAKLTVTGTGGAKDVALISKGIYGATLASSYNIPGLPGGIPIPGQSAPFLEPGNFQVNNGAGGVDVGNLVANLTIPANFTWTNEAAITSIVRANGLTTTWTGAVATDYVFITGGSFDLTRKVGGGFYCIERGNVGTFTVPSAVLLGIPASSAASGEVPAGSLMVGLTREPSRFTARGLDVGLLSFSAATMKNLDVR